MRWSHSEYLFKGIFLGLLLYVALSAPDPGAAATVGGYTLAGLALGLAVAAVGKFRAGVRPGGRPFAFLLFLLLESPKLVYAGVVFGLGAGALAVRPPDADGRLLIATVGGGVAVGVGLAALHSVQCPKRRLIYSLLAGAGVVAAGILTLEYYPDLVPEADRRTLGVFLLLGLPFFYLLTFAGEAEESEVEVAAWCTAFALGIWLIKVTPTLPLLALAVPALLYYGYSRYVMPGLRVFKHTLRGMSYARLGRYRPALASLRRAVELDPANRLAREALWDVHRDLDAGRIAADPELVRMVDPDLCLERAGSILTDSPTPQKRSEAVHLLDLVEGQSPGRAAQVLYWRAVAATHAKDFDVAESALSALLDPARWPASDPSRQAIILSAWQLATALHPELKRRVGDLQLKLPGRRLDAIAAAERALAAAPDDSDAWGLKRVLYSDLTEVEYAAGPVELFDYAYAEQLGLALVNDPARWTRGVEYLRIAACGLAERTPTIYAAIGKALEQQRDADAARAAYDAGKRAGLAFGPKQFADDQRAAYFGIVKRLAEDAVAREDWPAAISHYQVCTLSERSGVETYRTLADLYEKQGDALAAVRVVEQALLYNAKDRDLLNRRDRYYYSVTPEQLRSAPDTVRNVFDSKYCLQKARQTLDSRDLDLDMLDWAQHLAELALVLKPESLAAKVAVGRARMRRGERDEAVAILEAVRTAKPESFADGDDQEAYYLTCRLLGDLYLRELDKPDLAVQCFTEYRASSKSGADTLYKLGQAYEQLGEAKRAAKFYEQVTAYESHPLAPDARDALRRVGA
ncbi:MAG: tetratricopeptide repeat protein [Gemmataceae bacterium]